MVTAALLCGILLQESRDVGQVVEHLLGTSEWNESIIDRQIEDVELAWFHLQVTAQSLTQEQPSIERVESRCRARFSEDLTHGRTAGTDACQVAMLTENGQHLAELGEFWLSHPVVQQFGQSLWCEAVVWPAVTIREHNLVRIDMRPGEEGGEYGKAIFAIRTPCFDRHQAKHQVRTHVGADLEDQLGVLTERRRDIRGHARIALIVAGGGKLADRVGASRNGAHGYSDTAQGFNERGARKRRRVGDISDAHLLACTGSDRAADQETTIRERLDR